MPGDYYRVTGPWFVAGIYVEGGLVVQAAPTLDWMVRRRATLQWVLEYAGRHRWAVDKWRLRDADAIGTQPCTWLSPILTPSSGPRG